ncbi:MAG: hypothetical protein V4850_09495, partial [Myxococcota bacterium]
AGEQESRRAGEQESRRAGNEDPKPEFRRIRNAGNKESRRRKAGTREAGTREAGGENPNFLSPFLPSSIPAFLILRLRNRNSGESGIQETRKAGGGERQEQEKQEEKVRISSPFLPSSIPAFLLLRLRNSEGRHETRKAGAEKSGAGIPEDQECRKQGKQEMKPGKEKSSRRKPEVPLSLPAFLYSCLPASPAPEFRQLFLPS